MIQGQEKPSMLKRMLDTITGRHLDEALEKQSKTAADLKDAVAKARAKIDAEVATKEAEERMAAKAAGGK